MALVAYRFFPVKQRKIRLRVGERGCFIAPSWIFTDAHSPRQSYNNKDNATCPPKRRFIMSRPSPFILSAIFGLVCATRVLAGGDDPYDQSGVPIEVQPTDPSLTKIVLVAGRPSHSQGEHEFFAGCAILMKLFQENPGRRLAKRLQDI
jgi:hypothetical protein